MPASSKQEGTIVVLGVGTLETSNKGRIESNAEGRSRTPNAHSPSRVKTVRAPANLGQ